MKISSEDTSRDNTNTYVTYKRHVPVLTISKPKLAKLLCLQYVNQRKIR